MIAVAEKFADLCERALRGVPQEIHRDVASVGDVTGARRAGDLTEREMEVFADGFNHFVWLWVG